jgi:CDP-glycerol glycerophosphotransferase (TagB/SpsB family)
MKITPGYHQPDKIGVCDGFLVTSPFWVKIFSEKIGLDRKCLLPLGYPRNDIFADKTKEHNRFGRYLMWLPTYRQHRLHPEQAVGENFAYGMPEVETKEQLLKLDKYLQNCKIKLYFRPHPVQDLSGLKKEKLSCIELADDRFLTKNGITVYEMLAGAQGLITDYSSVYYDFLLTERAIGLTIRDSAEYFDYYGCPFEHLSENVKGFYIKNFDDVLTFIKEVKEGNVPESENILEMKKKYHLFADGKASERIYRYMEEKCAEDKRTW